jgi:hypothetical protein
LKDEPILRFADSEKWLELFGFIDLDLLVDGLWPVTPLHLDRRNWKHSRSNPNTQIQESILVNAQPLPY